MEKEQFYDENIAPELVRLGQLAQDNGVSLIAVVEWLPGETGRTVTLAENSSFSVRMVEAATRCHGNIDTFLIAMMKYAREHGHSSIFLKELGVPCAKGTAS